MEATYHEGGLSSTGAFRHCGQLGTATPPIAKVLEAWGGHVCSTKAKASKALNRRAAKARNAFPLLEFSRIRDWAGIRDWIEVRDWACVRNCAREIEASKGESSGGGEELHDRC